MSAARIKRWAVIAALATAVPATAQELPRTLVSETDMMILYNVSKAFAANLSEGTPPQTQIIYTSCLYDKPFRTIIADVKLALKNTPKPTGEDLERAIGAVCVRSPIIKLKP